MTTSSPIFTPVKFGPIVAKNRIVFGPHATNQWPEHKADARTVEYYERRARGGVGTIIIGGSEPDERSNYYPLSQPGMWMDDVVPGLRAIADAVHKYDCRLLIQLLHPGHMHNPTADDDWRSAVAPSEIPTVFPPAYAARALRRDEIYELIETFAEAAARAQTAGLDGVELQAAHGYLLGQFMSPVDNRRTDEFSAKTIEGRARLTEEVVRAIRRRCGDSFAIGCRISADEHMETGATRDEILAVSKRIADAGVDYLSVTAGTYRSAYVMIPTRLTRAKGGYNVPLAERMKAYVGRTPVMVAGMLAEPAQIEDGISAGKFDAAVVVRQLIADPEYANKVGDPGQGFHAVRPCMYLNQGCVGRMLLGQRIECHANPEGFRAVPSVRTKAKVAIIGAGPAGLEASHLAAKAGFDVSLFEREMNVGGQTALMTRLPGCDDVRTWVAWSEREARRSGVGIQLGTELTQADVKKLSDEYAYVIVATGAIARKDGTSAIEHRPVPGVELAHVRTYEEMLVQPDNCGQNVVIYDDLGDRIAPGIAQLLGERGRRVTIVTRWQSLGQVWLNLWAESPTVQRIMGELNVEIIPDSVLTQIDDNIAFAVNIYSRRIIELQADTVVLVTMRSSTPLPGASPTDRVFVIGDAAVPRLMGEALRDARVTVERIALRENERNTK